MPKTPSAISAEIEGMLISISNTHCSDFTRLAECSLRNRVQLISAKLDGVSNANIALRKYLVGLCKEIGTPLPDSLSE